MSLPLAELLVTRSHTLHLQLVSTASALSSFLDTLQTLADNASNSKGIQKCVLRISYDYFLLLYVRNHSERKFWNVQCICYLHIIYVSMLD